MIPNNKLQYVNVKVNFSGQGDDNFISQDEMTRLIIKIYLHGKCSAYTVLNIKDGEK